MEHEVTYLITHEDLLRLEKALRGADQFLDEDTPPSVREDVRNSLRLVEVIRGK
jgi:hypothetical protein